MSAALPLATAAGLVFEIEETLAGLPAHAFKRGHTRLSYKAPRGAPVRACEHSGVYIAEPPFGLPARSLTKVMEDSGSPDVRS
ncbi:MAG: hypothetical protein ABIR79_00030 [Candidatus Binatia bacterium]